MTRRQFFFLATLILLAFFITRLHGLLTMPLFMDEATHITRSQAVWQGKPFDLLLTGKALTPYFAALFYPFDGAIWIGRYVVVLVGGIGIAAVMVLARALHSRSAGILAGILWLFSPYFFFFERMALVDTSVAALATLSVYLAYRTMKRGQFIDAIWCAVALTACIAAKTTGIVFLAMPGGAWFLFSLMDRRAPRKVQRFLLMIVIYVAAGALLIIPALYIQSQAANVLGIGALSSVETASLGDRLRNNPGIAWTAFADYYSPFFWSGLLLASAICLVFRMRRGLYLLAFAAIPLLALFATATNLYLRYLVIGLPGLLVAGSIGMLTLTKWLHARRGWWLAGVTVGAWIVLWSLPFLQTAYINPPALPVPTNDQYEYLTGWTSGYGLRDVALDLIKRKQEKSITTTAILGSCNTIRLYLPANGSVPFNCPNVWEGGGVGDATKLVRDQVAVDGTAWMIIERAGPVPESALPVFNREIARYLRPGGAFTILLVEVESVSQ